jgi:hypothetical protein
LATDDVTVRLPLIVTSHALATLLWLHPPISIETKDVITSKIRRQRVHLFKTEANILKKALTQSMFSSPFILQQVHFNTDYLQRFSDRRKRVKSMIALCGT